MSYYNITLSSSASSAFLPFLLVNGTYYNGGYNTIYNGTFDAISGLAMDSISTGNQKGYGMLSNSTSSMTTSFYNTYASAGLRLLLEPNDPIQNSQFTVTSSNVNLSNSTCFYTDTTNSFIYYSPIYITNGPVNYENWPEQYQQQYTLIFPELHELSSGILRIQSVLVNGLDGSGSILPENRQQTINLSNQNIQNFCVNNCGYINSDTTILNISGTLRIPIHLSGLTTLASNTIYLSTSFSYDVYVTNGSQYSWPNGKPTATIRILFDRSSLYTHRMKLQGHVNDNQDWNNLDSIGSSPFGTPTNGWLVDLRIVNDLLMYNRASSYSLLSFLYPQTSTVNSPSILNVNYVIPLSAL